jgi:hypothetical protein
MKNFLLFPRICRTIGFILLPFSTWLLNSNHEFSFLKTHTNINMSNNNLTDEFATAGIIISLLMIAFSKLKHEDEYVKHIRLQSLQIGVYVNYGVFLLMTFAVYGVDYLGVLLYNTLTVLVLFILVFNYNLYIKPRIFKPRSA